VVKSEKTAAASDPAATTKSKETLKPKMDFGMSKPEDKDMYTTRG